MIRKKRYLAAKMGLLALAIAMLLPGQKVDAADKKTIYNSPYVSFSPDGKAFTTCAGDRDYTWYDADTRVSTGITSSLRALNTGEHYYKVSRYGEIPIGYWQVSHRPAQCIHNGYPEDNYLYHGIQYGRHKCLRNYNSGWMAYCADCGEVIAYANMYMSRDAAKSIQYMDLGSKQNPMEYYFLCPFCNNLEQGAPLGEHKCKEISWNQYRIFYDPNIKKYNGYMDYSYHMYNNETIYEGETVTPVTHLTENNYTRVGYVFTGWNTKQDGSGVSFTDKEEIYNLSSSDWNDQSTWTDTDRGTITLYAQWRKSESTLVIDANGGRYNGVDKYSLTEPYSSKYLLQKNLIVSPNGYTVAFETNGGTNVDTITGTMHFVEWMQIQPFNGFVTNDTYMFMAPDRNIDTLKAAYQPDPITLPSTTKDGWSFGGWYYDPDFSLPAGGAGDQIIPSKDMTLYAQWVDLRLQSVDNYDANDGKGAVDLSWSQSDQNNKTYLVYQKREDGAWIRVNSANDISSTTIINQAYNVENKRVETWTDNLCCSNCQEGPNAHFPGNPYGACGNFNPNWEKEIDDSYYDLTCGKTTSTIVGYRCGMYNGQILSSKPAYGGSNYVNSAYAMMYETYSGVRSGSGVAELHSKAIGYQESLDLAGVTAPDFAAPDKISDQVTKEPLDGKSIRVTWQVPSDNGTDYYHKVESYLTGSTSMLCGSNVTKNTLVSGVMGYYYLVDQNGDTVVTGNANYVQDPHVNVVTAEYNQYLHIAAVDVAGNISETTHILIDAKDVLWKLYTKQLVIDASADNVYPATDKSWYVRADGSTPFTLKNEAYMDGTASQGYQLNETIYETVSDDSSVARNIIRTASTEIADTSIRTDANGLAYSTDGTTALQQYSYSYTVRSNKNRDLMGVQKFTISRDLSGQTIQVIPVAEADKESDKVYSAHELDEKNKITLIADGEAPVIRGLEIMEDRDLIDRRDGSITIRASAEDELSGVKDFYIVISNSDNAVMKTYTPDENGYINITITNDEPIFSGDFTLLGYAVDNVGNENNLSYGTTEFALASSVERILSPHDPIFKCGESGILTFTTWGYADRVEVIFPESMTALDPTLNKVYDYTDCPGYMITEHLQFMVPLYTPENQNLEITVRAYKGDKKLEDHPTISVIGVSGTVLDEFRTRLR